MAQTRKCAVNFKQELLTLSAFVETHIYFYLMDRFPVLNNRNDFCLHKYIDVAAPFGNENTRKIGLSRIKPEICVVNNEFGFVAEAAAWADNAPANKQSESHRAMHKIGLPSDSVYFAQKIMCQVFPAYLYCMQDGRKVYSFMSITENRITKMVNVLDHLKKENFLDYSRPMGENSCDILQYHQAIFEIKFPDRTDEIVKKIIK
jgi:hypothetical protein